MSDSEVPQRFPPRRYNQHLQRRPPPLKPSSKTHRASTIADVPDASEVAALSRALERTMDERLERLGAFFYPKK